MLTSKKQLIESFQTQELESRLEFKGWVPEVTVSCDSSGTVSVSCKWN